MYELELSAKGVDVKICAVFLGSDLLVWLTGGAAHMGVVTVAVPRPSLSGDGSVSADVSIIATGGHKEDMLARKIALALAGKLNAKVSVVAGMHWDNATEEQLTVAQALSAKLAKGLLEQIAEGKPLPPPPAAPKPVAAPVEDVLETAEPLEAVEAVAEEEPPRPKYVSIKADLDADIKPGQTEAKPLTLLKPAGVKSGTGSGSGAKPVVGKPISIKPGNNKSISISTGSGRFISKPSTGKTLPGARPAGTRPPGSRPPGARPPGTRPPGTRPPGAKPQGTRPPEERPAGERPAGERPPVKKSPPEFED